MKQGSEYLNLTFLSFQALENKIKILFFADLIFAELVTRSEEFYGFIP